MKTLHERGFSAVEAVIAVLVVAAIGVTGYLAFNRMQNTAKAPSASDQAAKATTPEAPAIEDDSDLDAAAKALDETNVDASATDASELDTEVSSF